MTRGARHRDGVAGAGRNFGGAGNGQARCCRSAIRHRCHDRMYRIHLTGVERDASQPDPLHPLPQHLPGCADSGDHLLQRAASVTPQARKRAVFPPPCPALPASPRHVSGASARAPRSNGCWGQGSAHEAMLFAMNWTLPIVFHGGRVGGHDRGTGTDCQPGMQGNRRPGSCSQAWAHDSALWGRIRHPWPKREGQGVRDSRLRNSRGDIPVQRRKARVKQVGSLNPSRSATASTESREDSR
jgi:hypothetical protein